MQLSKEDDAKLNKKIAELGPKFDKMMKTLFKEKGASLRVEVLKKPDVEEFIEAHASVLDSSFDEVQMSDLMRQRLQESDYMFSGLKTFHELNEAFPSLLDDNGNRKSFNQFRQDVEKINATYNTNYLKTEYNFANAAAEMAGRWEEFEKDGDRYLLQYRTANDGSVRPEHAALHGITLPASDDFWNTCYPPNGYNCFTGDTPILSGNGQWKFIKEIKEGDSVIGGSGKVKTVSAVMVRPFYGELVTVSTKRGEVSCTPNHRFLTLRGWVTASNLTAGDILVQVGKIGFKNIAVRAIYNLQTLLSYALMPHIRQRKAIMPLTVHDNTPVGKIEVKNVLSEQFPKLKRLPRRTEKISHFSFGCAGRHSKSRHILRMGRAGSQRMDKGFLSRFRSEKGTCAFELFRYASNQCAILFRFALSYMSALKRKIMIYGSKAFSCLFSPFKAINPLSGHCLSSVPNRNTVKPEQAGDSPVIDMPKPADLSVAELSNTVPGYKGLNNIGIFNGFDSLYNFLRNTFFHNDYVLVRDKIIKKAETVVYNLSVEDDESYVTPVAIVHNCRCTVVQVLSSDYEATPHDEAMQRAQKAMAKDTKGMFAYNPGKQQRTFPAYNAYTTSKCKHCSLGGGKANLLKLELPDNQLCEACRMLHECEGRKNGWPKIPKEEVNKILAKPLKEQYSKVYSGSKGDVLEHTLVCKTAEDYDRVMDAAKSFADNIGECKVNPPIRAAAPDRGKIYVNFPERCNKSNPDMFVKGIGYVDVKSPVSFENAGSNAVHASLRQNSCACITEHNLKNSKGEHTEFTPEQIASKTNSLWRNKDYSHDYIFWLTKGALIKYKRPKK